MTDVVIKKGLKPGETVVTEGQLRLEPGTRDPRAADAGARAAGRSGAAAGGAAARQRARRRPGRRPAAAGADAR